jgi:hypothetical protein
MLILSESFSPEHDVNSEQKILVFNICGNLNKMLQYSYLNVHH